MNANRFPHACFLAWCALLVWAPLPNGSSWPWATLLLTFLTFALALVLLAVALRRRYALADMLRPYAWPLGLLLCAPLWAWAQLLPLDFDLLARLSPRSAELWQASGAEQGRLTLDVGRTQLLATWSTALWCFLAMSLVLLDSRERVRTAVMVVVYCGAFQALYGSFMALSGIDYYFFLEKTTYRGVATGTFWGRNLLAGYLGMCLALGTGLLVGSLDRNRTRSLRDSMRKLLDTLLGSKFRLRLLLFIMVIALVLTRSRMGNTAFFASLCLAAAILMLIERKLHKGSLVLFGSMLLIDFLIVGQWFGFDKLAERLQGTSVETENRDEVFRDTLTMIGDFPLTGSGLGSNTAVFPQYQGADVGMFMEHAHNDFLQFTSDLGLIGMAPLALLVLLSFGRALYNLYKRRDQLAKGMAFAAIMGIMALMIHSTADYNLQYPAQAQLFVLLLAFAWISGNLPHRDRGEHVV